MRSRADRGQSTRERTRATASRVLRRAMKRRQVSRVRSQANRTRRAAQPFFLPGTVAAGTKAGAVPGFALARADFFGFFASRPERICPLAIAASHVRDSTRTDGTGSAANALQEFAGS